MSNEAEIRNLVDRWAGAPRAKDTDSLMALYADDVVAFDLAPPLEHKGADAMRKGLEDWFPTWRGPIGYEVRELDVAVSGDLAVCRSKNHMTGKRTSGEDTDLWFRATVSLRKIGGAWKIVHEHVSVPFRMDGSEKAALDLKP